MTKPEARGRRPGRPDLAAHILAVARQRFLHGGPQAVTLRAVAADAGVDAALLNYYFGSKQGLLSAALRHTGNPTDPVAHAIEGSLASLPERSLRSVLAHWEHPESGGPLRALLSGAANDQAISTLVKGMIETTVIDPLASVIGDGEARQRASAFCAHLVGLVVTRYILRVEPLASMSPDEVVTIYLPAMQKSLTASTED